MARIRYLSKDAYTILGGKLKFPPGVRNYARQTKGGVFVRIIPRRKDHADEYKILLREQEHCNKGSLVKRRKKKRVPTFY